MISRLTCQGYAKKVRTAMERHGGTCAVITTDSGLHFVAVRSVPNLVAVYSQTVPEGYLLEDALELGLRE